MSKDRIALGVHSYFSDVGSLSLFKIERSTQKLTAVRIHYFDIRLSTVSFSIRLAATRLAALLTPETLPTVILL